jgi:hypothetical protein
VFDICSLIGCGKALFQHYQIATSSLTIDIFFFFGQYSTTDHFAAVRPPCPAAPFSVLTSSLLTPNKPLPSSSTLPGLR